MKLDIIFRNNAIQFSLKNRRDETIRNFSFYPFDTYPLLSQEEKGYVQLPSLPFKDLAISHFNKDDLTCQTITDGTMQTTNHRHFLDKFFACYSSLFINNEAIFCLSFPRKSDKKELQILIKKDAIAVGFGEIFDTMAFEKAVSEMEKHPVSFSDIVSFFKEELDR